MHGSREEPDPCGGRDENHATACRAAADRDSVACRELEHSRSLGALIAGHPAQTTGHCGIVDYDGWTISARPDGIGRKSESMLDGTCRYNKPKEDNNDEQ